MSSALFLLFGLGVVGAAIWFGNRPGSPRGSSDAWPFGDPNRTLPPDVVGCAPGDRDGDGIPDGAQDRDGDGVPDSLDDNDGFDSDGDGSDTDGGSDSGSD